MQSGASILERMLEEVPNSPHPSPFPIEKTPYFEGPWFDIGRRAVELLEDPEEIKQFMDEYVSHISEEYHVDKEKAEKSAKNVLGYCTGYVDDDQANRWFEALPDISHPVTSKERPFKGVDFYYIVAPTEDNNVIEYLNSRLADFSDLFDIESLKPTPENPYVTFKLTPRPGGFNASDSYLFLTGVSMGITGALKKDIGVETLISVEVPRTIN